MSVWPQEKSPPNAPLSPLLKAGSSQIPGKREIRNKRKHITPEVMIAIANHLEEWKRTALREMIVEWFVARGDWNSCVVTGEVYRALFGVYPNEDRDWEVLLASKGGPPPALPGAPDIDEQRMARKKPFSISPKARRSSKKAKSPAKRLPRSPNSASPTSATPATERI